MGKIEKKAKLIELRGKGYSYDYIAKTLHVSKATLINWAKDLSEEIVLARDENMELLKKQFHLTIKNRLKLLGTQYKKISRELKTRKLKDIETDRLLTMLLNIDEKIKEEISDGFLKIKTSKPLKVDLSNEEEIRI